MGTRSPSGRYWDWPWIVGELRKHPGVWFVRLTNAPARVVRTIHDRSAPALQMEDGKIEANIVNGHTHEGRRRGDIYLRFVPHPPKEKGTDMVIENREVGNHAQQ